MNKTANSRIYYITQAAAIAAIYAILTYLSTALNLSFGLFQLRFSEALVVLPIFTSAAIPGLAIGCFISNIASPFGIVDILIGSLATFIAAILTRKLSNLTIKGFPFLSILSPAIVNALFVPVTIAMFSGGQSTFMIVYLAGVLSVGISELICCFGLGTPLYAILKHNNKFDKIFK